jgi:hypothetical protein
MVTLTATVDSSRLQEAVPEWETCSWEDVIHSCCLMLRHSSPQVMPEISVKVRLPGAPGVALPIILRARRIADKYNIAALAGVEPHVLTVRLISRVNRGDDG